MKRLIALGVTALLLGVILASVDRAELWRNLAATRALPFAVALLFFVPQYFVGSLRWKMMASHFVPMTWGQAVGMILASQTLNLVLPSKLGDLTKAYFLKSSRALDLGRATNLVVFEKMLDLAALCLLAVVGAVVANLAGFEFENPTRFLLLSALTFALALAGLAAVAALYLVPIDRLPFYRRAMRGLETRPKLGKLHRLLTSSHEVMTMLQRREARRGTIALLSVLIWCLHMAQIYFFFLSLNAAVPVLALCALIPLAIFIGLLPISFAGIGTRDVAIIFLFAPWHPPETLAGVGFYVSLRYLIPALAGLPFLTRYLGLAREAQSAKRESRMNTSHR